MKDYPHIDYWSDLHIEVYCGINWEYAQKCSEYDYLFDPNKDVDDWERVKNEKYDPDAVPNEFPEDCTRELTIKCLDCEYCGYCEYDEDLEEDGL